MGSDRAHLLRLESQCSKGGLRCNSGADERHWCFGGLAICRCISACTRLVIGHDLRLENWETSSVMAALVTDTRIPRVPTIILVAGACVLQRCLYSKNGLRYTGQSCG